MNERLETEIKPSGVEPSMHAVSRKKRPWLAWIVVILLIFGAFRVGYASGVSGLSYNPSEFA